MLLKMLMKTVWRPEAIFGFHSLNRHILLSEVDFEIGRFSADSVCRLRQVSKKCIKWQVGAPYTKLSGF